MSRAHTMPLPSFRGRALEALEDRCVPAGNVLADQVGAALTLVGDDLANAVWVLPGARPGEVVVVGDATTVNGAARQTFAGVEDLFVLLQGGDDALAVAGVTLAAASDARVLVDGGPGDDRIDLTGTVVRAGEYAEVQVYGERVSAAAGSGTTGNDTIRLTGVRVASGSVVSVKVYGETNDGGVLTGGNDTIAVTGSAFVALGGAASATVEVYGDSNSALAGMSSSIAGGNDVIAIRGTTVVAAGGASGNTANLILVGDANAANGFDPATGAGGDARSTIGGGNDAITVQGVAVTAAGPSANQAAALTVEGDRDTASGPDAGAGVAAVGGGDDAIAVAGSVVTAVGGSAVVAVTGDRVEASGSAGTDATVGGGSDTITVTNTAVVGGGLAAVFVQADTATAGGSAAAVIGVGNDRVTLTGSLAGTFVVSLGDGDDALRFDGNVAGTGATLDGGPGFDRLRARGDLGPLVWSGFEDVDGGR